jgi:hypothetical protein
MDPLSPSIYLAMGDSVTVGVRRPLVLTYLRPDSCT